MSSTTDLRAAEHELNAAREALERDGDRAAQERYTRALNVRNALRYGVCRGTRCHEQGWHR